jgi:serine/threonine protein phosphatase PrpC
MLVAGATDIGPVRGSNEDNFLLDEQLGLAMLADGMGGHAAGEVASAGRADRECRPISHCTRPT